MSRPRRYTRCILTMSYGKRFLGGRGADYRTELPQHFIRSRVHGWSAGEARTYWVVCIETTLSFLIDFDILEPDTMLRGLPKTTVEEKRSIRIFELAKSSAFKERFINQRNFRLGGTEVTLKLSPLGGGWYLDLVNPGLQCTDTAIGLLWTSCNYGGNRLWFECPKCSRRAGVLYLDKDAFHCRTCLGLGYRTQRMNYQTLTPTFWRWAKLQKMDPERCRTYRGRPTKYTIRYYTLQGQVGWGMDNLGQKYSAKISGGEKLYAEL